MGGSERQASSVPKKAKVTRIAAIWEWEVWRSQLGFSHDVVRGGSSHARLDSPGFSTPRPAANLFDMRARPTHLTAHHSVCLDGALRPLCSPCLPPTLLLSAKSSPPVMTSRAALPVELRPLLPRKQASGGPAVSASLFACKGSSLAPVGAQETLCALCALVTVALPPCASIPDCRLMPDLSSAAASTWHCCDPTRILEDVHVQGTRHRACRGRRRQGASARPCPSKLQPAQLPWCARPRHLRVCLRSGLLAGHLRLQLFRPPGSQPAASYRRRCFILYSFSSMPRSAGSNHSRSSVRCSVVLPHASGDETVQSRSGAKYQLR